jgi:hypothetical protein
MYSERQEGFGVEEKTHALSGGVMNEWLQRNLD